MAISKKVIRKLWATSGGFCGKPDCHADLFPFFENGQVTNIEELAHIIAQKKKGPRGNNSLALTERDEFDNIIILCPSCHTLIDKNPGVFPIVTIREWKKQHLQSIENIFKIPTFNTRQEVHKYLQPFFSENRKIFDTYGPYSENAKSDPPACELMWDRLAKEKILPNNRKIEKVIEQNQSLLTEEESSLFQEFKIHREGFEFNKLSGDVNAMVPRFPANFQNIYK